MHRTFLPPLLACLPLALVACGTPGAVGAAAPGQSLPEERAGRMRPVRIASLGGGEGLRALLDDYQADHPGHDILDLPGMQRHEAGASPSVVFVQRGEGMATMGTESSEVRVGDIALLRPGQALEVDGDLDAVAFVLPLDLPPDLPSFIRVDFDPSITDTPGGCATDPGAYRRVALTWLASRGPYILHGFNAHRVRIDDSFTHYHPVEGGFDEFYLVQEAPAGARLLTSTRLSRISDPSTEDPTTLPGLFDVHELEAGDLVYIPRGVAHRGLGGAVVHVLAVPGFRPGGEVGLDHVLHELNELHGLGGEDALPLHEAGARQAVVK